MATPKWNKERKLWVIQGQKNGIRKVFYSSVPGMKGKRDVLDKYDDWVEFGGSSSLTVERCVQLYLQDIEARIGRKDGYREAEIYTRLYVLPALGRCKMDKLTLRDWQAVLNEARPHSANVQSLSHKTLTHLRAVIVGLHKFAYRNYYCDDWRGQLYIPQGHKRGEREILQPDDISRLFEPCDSWYFPAFLVMLVCGLRPGEAYGIQTGDINGQTSSPFAERSTTRASSRMVRTRMPDVSFRSLLLQRASLTIPSQGTELADIRLRGCSVTAQAVRPYRTRQDISGTT